MVPSKPSVPRSSSVRLALAAAAHDEPVRRLVVPRFLSLGRLTPGRNRVAATRSATLPAAMRVIDRVHRHTAYRRPAAQPTTPAGLADDDVLLIGVRHRADRRPALGAHHAQLTRGEAQQRVTLVPADELDIGPC